MIRFAPLLIALVATPALAQRTQTGAVPERQAEHFERASADVESVTRDGQGRELRRTIEHWNKESTYTGKTVFESTWTDGSRSRVRRTSYDAAHEVTAVEVTAFSTPRPHCRHIDSRLSNGQGGLLRTELSDIEPGDDGSTLTTTVVTDGEGALIETRYTVARTKTPPRGRGTIDSFSSTDMSVYDAQGVQKSRFLVERRGLRSDRWTFDEEDVIAQHEVEHRTEDAKGRTVTISSETFNAAGGKVAGREEEYSYLGPNDGMSRHVMTWYDGEGVGTQRRTSNTMFRAGASAGARILWESWAPPAP